MSEDGKSAGGKARRAPHFDLAELPGEPFFRIMQQLKPRQKMLLQSVCTGLRDALEQPEASSRT